jgi:hypothetical protein
MPNWYSRDSIWEGLAGGKVRCLIHVKDMESDIDPLYSTLCDSGRDSERCRIAILPLSPADEVIFLSSLRFHSLSSASHVLPQMKSPSHTRWYIDAFPASQGPLLLDPFNLLARVTKERSAC